MYNVCTMYTTAVGVILARQLARVVCTEMNTIFGATFVGHCMYNVCTMYVQCMYVVCTRDEG